jgi:uncharacterized membrane protein YeiH
MLHAYDLLGTFVFGLSGALLAVRKRMDVFGVIVLAIAAGLGGGIVRDVLIGATPPLAVEHWEWVTVAATAGLVGFAIPHHVGRAWRAVLLADAAGLGLFAVAGAAKAHQHGVPALGATVIGTIAAVGGGVLRDVLAGDSPQILHSEVYATPAAIAAAIVAFGSRSPAVEISAAVLATTLRAASLRWDWRAPKRRLT